MPDGACASGQLGGALDTQVAWCEPQDAAEAFADMAVLALLDSAGPVRADSRYAYLCIDPFEVLTVQAGVAAFNGVACAGDPLRLLDAAMARHRRPAPARGAPFTGGAVGYVGYDAGVALHGIAMPAAGEDGPPEMFVGFYDLVVAFDRARRTVSIHASGAGGREVAGRLRFAAERLTGVRRRGVPKLPEVEWRPAWTADAYRARVRRVTEYIEAGDIFQANLTMPHETVRPAGLTDCDVQAALRARNPAKFAAWLRCGGFALCGSSPERFVSLDAAGMIETRPIKGTARRMAEPAADEAARRRLEESAKDRAENIMIVDVLRNDIGRVAEIGSVSAPELCAPEATATLHHLVSTVRGRLRPGLRAVDLLRAALPGGSITGAPKHRAMQIIAELEGRQRGPYCGTVFWLGFDGAMDSNIVIRTLVLTPERVVAQAGGGNRGGLRSRK